MSGPLWLGPKPPRTCSRSLVRSGPGVPHHHMFPRWPPAQAEVPCQHVASASGRRLTYTSDMGAIGISYKGDAHQPTLGAGGVSLTLNVRCSQSAMCGIHCCSRIIEVSPLTQCVAWAPFIVNFTIPHALPRHEETGRRRQDHTVHATLRMIVYQATPQPTPRTTHAF